jgi:putative transposase
MTPPDVLRTLPRKRVRHFDLPGDAHFLTFSCFHRLPLLSKDRTRKWLVEAIADARIKHGFELWAWVIMPEHVHLLINPRSTETRISDVLADMKRPVAQRAIAYLVARNSSFLARLTVRNANRTYRRYWQAGPGQDHNIYDPETAHRVVEYIHNNPVRRGLVQRATDWAWSSAADWEGQLEVPIRVDRSLPPFLEVSSG